MQVDPNTPVIVGVGQVNGRDGWSDPLELYDLAIDRAAKDSGSASLAGKVDILSVVRSSTLRIADQGGAMVARRGWDTARIWQSNFGGHMSQELLRMSANTILAGEAHVAMVLGAETGVALPSADLMGTLVTPERAMIGDNMEDWIWHPVEARVGMSMPIQTYPLLEVALAWDKGQRISDHMVDVSEMWERFSCVARGNPYAVDRRGHGAKEIRTATRDNRYVGYPYTKMMNSNPFVDQACAIILCSTTAADAAGVPLDRRIYPYAMVEARQPFIAERSRLSHAPALIRAGEAITNLTGVAPPDAELIELYSCFPSAVQIQAESLGLDIRRQLTLTGGMAFAGGPLNTYTMHMIANMVDRLRERPEALGYCSANAGFASRFHVGGYSASPPPQPFQGKVPTFQPLPGEAHTITETPEGFGTIEGFSVSHDRTGTPFEAFAVCHMDDDTRGVARFTDAASLKVLTGLESKGARVRFSAGAVELLP